jgi:hypothetical protein
LGYSELVGKGRFGFSFVSFLETLLGKKQSGKSQMLLLGTKPGYWYAGLALPLCFLGCVLFQPKEKKKNKFVL